MPGVLIKPEQVAALFAWCPFCWIYSSRQGWWNSLDFFIAQQIAVPSPLVFLIPI
jgi:hypothetical protein